MTSKTIDYAALRNSGFFPRLHGNGFLQLDLVDGSRLHIWDPRLASYGQQVYTGIHDHRFSFKSEVIYGAQSHQEYELLATDFGKYYVTTPIRNPSTEDTKLMAMNDRLVDFIPRAYKVIERGSTYEFEYGRFHETIPESLTATLMVKTHEEPNWEVRVACLYDAAPDNDFDRMQVDTEVLWASVARVADLVNWRGEC